MQVSLADSVCFGLPEDDLSGARRDGEKMEARISKADIRSSAGFFASLGETRLR